MTIYIVEDDANIRELVLYTLRASGYAAAGFEDSRAFFPAVADAAPDLILLDIMLPGEDGLSILKRLRAGEKTRSLPVILLTAKNSEYDKVIGLDLGADDYVAKPFGMMELVSRIKAVLRRTAPAQEMPEKLAAGAIELYPGRRKVFVDGAAVELTMKEFDLLQLLMESPGLVFSRDRIMERIWGYSYQGETRTVDVHIRSLRQKLGAAGQLIETVRGLGYRMKETQ